MFGNTGPFSYAPGGFSPSDLQQHRRGLQQNDYGGATPQKNMSRPSSRSIYMQRKEYSEALNRQPDSVQARVEHLFTCELDGRDMKTVDDCVAKLKTLDDKGRLWPQEMIIEIQGGYLLLSDIETKAELEVLPLQSIQQTQAVLDSCAYNSLLAVTVRDGGKRFPQVFMFQCEETGAEVLKKDVDKICQRGGAVEPRREQPDIRSNMENLWQRPSFKQLAPLQQERTPPPPDHPAPQWANREQETISSPPRFYSPQEETVQPLNLPEFQSNEDVAPTPVQSDNERNAAILNHVLSDMETFMGKVSAAVNTPAPQGGKSKSKFRMPKQKKRAPPAVSLPSWEEYVSCLQKIKYGFNLLGQLNGILTSPTAPDFVHIFFRSLGMMLPHYPSDLPPTVLSPLLTDAALQLLSEVVSPEEDLLWRSLGDCWNIPRSRWPDDNVPPYIPEFYDGWQPPAPAPAPAPAPVRAPSPLGPPPYQSSPVSRSNSQRFPQSRPGGHMDDRGMQPKEPLNAPWGPPPPTRPTEPPLYMRVMYNFLARNNKEISVMKGEEVEVIQKSRQWWLVRNSRGEQGSIPQNVLESINGSAPMEDEMDSRGPMRAPVTLDMNSTSAQVRAWLQYKGFAKMTVTSLGVLNGKLLLGMTRDEIRTVCPEEGGRVFFQLQAVKSAIALASEPSGLYNSQY